MPNDLEHELDNLPEAVKVKLKAHHFDRARFLRLAKELGSSGEASNLVQGGLVAPHASDWQKLPAADSSEGRALTELGSDALAKGECALVVLAGGMATRMGGVVKALVEALPGKTFLELRLGEQAAIKRRFGKKPPLWLMVSEATQAKIQGALGSHLDGYTVADFPQGLAPRLTTTGSVYLDENGQPSLYATGHGDLPEALVQSGLLERFVNEGGRVVMVTNLDNLGGTLDPMIVGFHLHHRKAVTSEVVDKVENDRGGIPVRVDGKLMVLEEFRIPPSFDPSLVRVFNTNVFQFDARELFELRMPWTFFRVQKQVAGQTLVQFERLINEVTSHLDTNYLHMSREGASSRFLPCKDTDELSRRQPEILAVATDRGLI